MNFYQDLLRSKKFKERFADLIGGVPRKERPIGFNVARRYMPNQFREDAPNELVIVSDLNFRRKKGSEYYMPSAGLGTMDGAFDTASVFINESRFIGRDSLHNLLWTLYDERADAQECGGVIVNPLMLVVRSSPLSANNVLVMQSRRELIPLSDEELRPGIKHPELDGLVGEYFPGSAELEKWRVLGDWGLTQMEAIAGGLRDSGQYDACVLHWSHGDPGFEKQIGKLEDFSDEYVVNLPSVRNDIESVWKGWPPEEKGPKPTK